MNESPRWIARKQMLGISAVQSKKGLTWMHNCHRSECNRCSMRRLKNSWVSHDRHRKLRKPWSWNTCHSATGGPFPMGKAMDRTNIWGGFRLFAFLDDEAFRKPCLQHRRLQQCITESLETQLTLLLNGGIHYLCFGFMPSRDIYITLLLFPWPDWIILMQEKRYDIHAILICSCIKVNSTGQNLGHSNHTSNIL